MPPSDAERTTMAGRGRPSASPLAATRQLLAVGIDRGRLDGLYAMTAPHLNLFVTSSPSKALLWTRLEMLDLILLRFGAPLEQAIDLVQALIEANPVPPILLLVEPEAEAVAHHLARRQICAAQPVSITAEQLQEEVRRLLGPRSPVGAPPGLNPRGEPVGRNLERRPPAQIEAGVEESTSRQTALHPTAPSGHAQPQSIAHEHHATPGQPVSSPTTIRPVPQEPATELPAGWELPFLDQLVIELAHRLKNPLVSIKTFTHLLQERFNDPDFRARFYAIVNNDVIQLNDVVDRLLEFTEFSRPYPKLLALADELRQAKVSLDPVLNHRQMTIQLLAPEPGQAGPFQLHADPIQFRYLLKQLLLDSATTAPAGGHLHVRLVDHPAGRGEEPACAIVIETTMASTAPHLHEWLSLELLLAKNLMERHRGTITVTVDGSGHGEPRRRRVTAAFPLHAPPRHDGQLLTSVPAFKPAKSLTPANADRRRIPLTIAFRERRVSPRRQEHRTITFNDRRQSPEGEDARAPSHDDRPHSPGSPRPFTSG